VFTGRVQHRLHIGFEDPALATGTSQEIGNEFRRIRDEIHDRMRTFYSEIGDE
jgi:arsenate reductase